MKHANQTEFDAPQLGHDAPARHTRLFELIRQHRAAQDLATNAANLNEERVVSPEFANRFKRMAGRSLRQTPPDRSLAMAMRRAV